MLGDWFCTPAFRLKQWEINVPLHKSFRLLLHVLGWTQRKMPQDHLDLSHSVDIIPVIKYPRPSSPLLPPSSILANCKQIEDFTVRRPWNEVAVALLSLPHPLRLNSTVPLPTSPPLLSGTWTSLPSALRPQSTLTSLSLLGQPPVGVSFCGTKSCLVEGRKARLWKHVSVLWRLF